MEQNNRIENVNGKITLWNDTKGIGISFQEGQSLAIYTHEIVLKDMDLLGTPEGIKTMNIVVNELVKIATIKYPKEFKPLNN